MTTRKLFAFIYMLVFALESQAHPGHTHNQNIMERVLHAAETEWLAPLLIVILIGIVGYSRLKRAGDDDR